MTGNNQGDLTLVERLEAAECGSRELDADIAKAVGGQVVFRFKGYDWRADHVGIWLPLPAFTTSLDAALALAERVIDGAVWRVQKLDGGSAWATAGKIGEQESAYAKTPPLALCAAILKALNPEQSHGV